MGVLSESAGARAAPAASEGAHEGNKREREKGRKEEGRIRSFINKHNNKTEDNL